MVSVVKKCQLRLHPHLLKDASIKSFLDKNN